MTSWCFLCGCEPSVTKGCILSCHRNGKLTHQVYMKYDDDRNGLIHREDGPAILIWDDHGNLICKKYVINGLSHRINGPSIRRWENKQLKHEMYFIKGLIHREDGSAFKAWNDNGILIAECYYVSGQYHREDGPSQLKWNDNGVLINETWNWNGPPHTFGMMQTNCNNSFKRGKNVKMKDLIKAGKVILKFMKKTKLIRRRYEKIIENSIWWSFPGLGKILLELSGGL